MLDIREIEYWISRYENEADKLNDCVTLAALYSIRDRLRGGSYMEPQITAYSEASAPVGETLGEYGDSDFLRAVAGKDPVRAWSVMDELMDTLLTVNAKVYNSVMAKLSIL